MATMAETARDLTMSHTQAQWLYVVSDTNKQNGNLTGLINALYEGENVAYIYNITDDDPECRVSRNEFVPFCVSPPACRRSVSRSARYGCDQDT